VPVFAGSVLFAALVCLVSPFRSVRAYIESKVKPTAFTLRLTLTLILVATYVVSGVTLLVGVGGGIEWLPLLFILALSVASIKAWVLTVEVSR
jgi:small basic protein